MNQYKLLKDWTGFSAGSIVEIDAEVAKALLADGTAQDHDPEAEKAAAQEAEARRKEVADIATQAAKSLVAELMQQGSGKNGNGVNISVGKTEEEKMAFKGVGDQLNALYLSKTQGHDESQKRIDSMVKVATASGLNEAVDSEGAILVQTDIQTELERVMFETGMLMDQTQMVELSANSNAHEWMAVKDDDRTQGNRRGGITVSRTHEGVSTSASKPSFERRRIVAEKLGGHFFATEELLMDVPALASEVTDWFGEEFGFVIDDEIVNGTGAGEMVGILNSDATVTVAKESSQTTPTLIAENIEKMWSRLWAPSRRTGRARWYINQDIWPELFQLQHTVGTGGLPVFLPPSGIAESPFATLLGLPVVEIEQAKTLGTKGDIILADLSSYKIARKGGLQSQSSIHVKFLEGEVAFRFTMRINGQPKWRTALTPANGTNTQSPFIVLATRP